MSLNEEDRHKFDTLYVQELNAHSDNLMAETAAINLNVAKLHLKSAESANNVQIWLGLIVFFVVLISIIRIYK